MEEDIRKHVKSITEELLQNNTELNIISRNFISTVSELIEKGQKISIKSFFECLEIMRKKQNPIHFEYYQTVIDEYKKRLMSNLEATQLPKAFDALKTVSNRANSVTTKLGPEKNIENDLKAVKSKTQELKSEYNKDKNELGNIKQNIEKEIKKTEIEIEEIKKKHIKIKNERDGLQKKLESEYKNVNSTYIKNKNELAEIKKNIENDLKAVKSKTQELKSEYFKDNKSLDGLKKNIDKRLGKLKDEIEQGNKEITNKEIELQNINKKVASFDENIKELTLQLEPYEKMKKELEVNQENTRDVYQNKFNELYKLVVVNKSIIKSFNQLGFKDSDVKKSLEIISFQPKGLPFDTLIDTYKKLLECPIVNWHTKFMYYLEQIDLSNDKSLQTIKELSEHLSLELILPEPNDRFNALEHNAHSEEETSGVDRGRVVRYLVPGIKNDTAVTLKAKVILSK